MSLLDIPQHDDVALSAQERLEAIARDIELTQSTAVLRVGQLLHEAREVFRFKRDEGGFQGWVESRLSVSRATVYKLVKVYEEFGAKSVQNLDTLPKEVLYALAAPSTPTEVRDKVLDKASRGEKVTSADVRELKEKLADKADEIRTLKTRKQSAEADVARLLEEVRSKDALLERTTGNLQHLQEEVRRLSEPGTITVTPNEQQEHGPQGAAPQHSAYFSEGNIKTFNDLIDIRQIMERLPEPERAIGEIARRVRHSFSAEQFEEIAAWFRHFAKLWREQQAANQMAAIGS